MQKLTSKQVDWIIIQITKWYQIRDENEMYRGQNPSMADVAHSSLLRKLLSGEKIYKYPPPLNHSYPDYEAASGREVNVVTKPFFQMKEKSVVINQSRWTILRKEKEKYILQWGDDPAEWILRPRTEQEINKDTYSSIRTGEDYDLAIREMRLKYNRWALRRILKNPL